MTLLQRLKQRKLVQWLVAYAAAAWGVVEVVDVIGDQFQWSLALQQNITVLLVFGFLIALVVAWYHGEKGHQRVKVSEVVLIVSLVGGALATISLRGGPEGAADSALTIFDIDFLERDPNRIVVPPFRTAGAIPVLGYLREGMVDLVYARLAGEGGLRAVDPRTTLSRLRAHMLDPDRDPSIAESVTLAESLGAAYVLLGDVVGTPESVTLSATLMEIPGGSEVGRASVTGPQEELTALVDDLSARVLTTRAGLGASAIRAPLPAVQAYLAGRQLDRSGRTLEAVSEFDRALEQDSTFVAAAIGLLGAGLRLGDVVTDATARGDRLLRNWTGPMSRRDSLHVRTLVRPRITFVTREMAAIEDAIAEEPTTADLWYELGKEWLENGREIGDARWAEKARAALDRAAQLDPHMSVVLQRRMMVEFAAHDTVGLRDSWDRYAILDERSEWRDFYQWRVAVALEDEATLEDLRGRFASFPRQSVAWMTYSSVLDGIALDDAESALSSYVAAAASERERNLADPVRTTLDWARGRVSEMLPSSPGPFYFDDFEPQRRATVSQLEDAVASQAEPQGVFICLLGLSRWAMGETSDLGTIAERMAANEEVEAGENLRVCSTLLRGLMEVRASTGTRPSLEAADSLIRLAPSTRPPPSNAVLALAFESVGELDRALAAIRRRPYRFNTGDMREFVQLLRLEGRIAALAGDTAGAIAAYEHYLLLRTDPEPELVPEVERVEQELAALTGGAR